MVAAAELTSPEVESYLRRRTGVAASTTSLSWRQRLIHSRWTWLSLILILVYAATMWILMSDVARSRTAEDGTVTPGLNADALWLSAGKAWPTLAFWIVCFILVDRYKPQRVLVWFLAVAWGACAAVTGSYYVNSWVGTQMAVVDETSGVAAVRVAVFVAPFVEEASKACVVFLIAVVNRHRFSSRVSGAVIGGLAGAGFAFTENIIYYARVVVYGSYTSGAGDVMAYLDQLVWMRGVLTCFGHPLFTMMTGLGVAFAVTSRSKVVRVVAPVAGYLFAAFLHMFFNLWASVLSEEQLTPTLFAMVWLVVASVGFRLATSSVRQGRVIAARLSDYVTMGWLPPQFPAAFGRLRTRAWTVVMSLFHANVVKTWQLQTTVTELAVLRCAITAGTVDRGGLGRERELVERIDQLMASGGLVDGTGLRPVWPWKRWRPSRWTSSLRHWLLGPSSNATSASPMKYSAVDPRWGPPQ
ncbi:MAG: PrsW family intramembrane metalloprotease [Propionibacteriaceae bacterium]|jgi:RsiW-degrading membrane proteinase PrsW (M82 family)|nr:PrsW family intramembrane metalloprotease [Propionibacteriaceae bacterium]